jgi:hypothetical protein
LEQFGFFGEDLFIAFSPECVDPGHRDWTTKNTPKVVGGITEVCSDVATAWYRGRWLGWRRAQESTSFRQYRACAFFSKPMLRILEKRIIFTHGTFK